MNRVLRAAAIAVLLALVANGCGDEESSEPAESDPTRAEFVAGADAICERLDTESARLAEDEFGSLDRKPGRAKLRSFARRTRGLQRRALAELRALTAPPGDEDEVGRVWDALETAIDEIAAIPPERPGKPGGRAERALARFGELANEYGLGGCARGL